MIVMACIGSNDPHDIYHGVHAVVLEKCKRNDIGFELHNPRISHPDVPHLLSDPITDALHTDLYITETHS